MTCSLAECHATFQPKNSLHQYCSEQHRAKANRLKSAITKICEYCSEEFIAYDKRQKFCNHSCAASSTNSGINRHRATQKTEKIQVQKPDPRYCHCGVELRVYQTRACSREHAHLAFRQRYIAEWLAGRESGSNSDGMLKHFCREYLVEQANHRCTSPTCAVPGGWSVPNPVTGRPILTVDHVDGNWKNNAIENLIVLCYSCHTLTPTFNSLNRGNGAGFRGSAKRHLTIA